MKKVTETPMFSAPLAIRPSDALRSIQSSSALNNAFSISRSLRLCTYTTYTNIITIPKYLIIFIFVLISIKSRTSLS